MPEVTIQFSFKEGDRWMDSQGHVWTITEVKTYHVILQRTVTTTAEHKDFVRNYTKVSP